MERRNSSEHQSPIAYSISKREFSPGFFGRRKSTREKAEVEQYKFGDRVTRDNFTSMLIDSFTQSRGIPIIQHAYFSWLQSNTGFDFREAIRNYIDAGGWGTLSIKEQQRIQESYTKRPHRKFFNEKSFDFQVENNGSVAIYQYKPLIPTEELLGMSRDVFLSRIRAEYKIIVSPRP